MNNSKERIVSLIQRICTKCQETQCLSKSNYEIYSGLKKIVADIVKEESKKYGNLHTASILTEERLANLRWICNYKRDNIRNGLFMIKRTRGNVL